MHILVTGGFGYIGSHVVDALVQRGHTVDVIDFSKTKENYDFVTSRCRHAFDMDVSNFPQQIECRTAYDAVIHLAAFISVEESTKHAHQYWSNNLSSTMALGFLETDHLIFSSTGTAFKPTSPYAETKVACERYILDVAASPQPWFAGHTVFRFYNVSGLKEGIRPTGQPTHLIRLAAMAAKGLRSQLSVFGTDYAETKDGTAVRDYIHVEDIAASICSAVDNGPANTPYECLGTGNGYSVLDVVQSMKRVSGVDFDVTMAPRRAGDDALMVCTSQYKHLVISKTLDDMCLSAYQNV